RLIEQMGGEIGVDSTPGEGSEFWISLKLPKAREDKEESLNLPVRRWSINWKTAACTPWCSIIWKTCSTA
ncbi:sensor histidine kinase/response regulator GacS, partial [Pseudomonas syringae pv. actinidiae ICMP 18804]